MDDILGLSGPPQSADVKRIKSLVRDQWGVPEDVVVMVSELHCHEDGCPDVETIIALMPGGGRGPESYKVPLPMKQVDQCVIAALRDRL